MHSIKTSMLRRWPWMVRQSNIPSSPITGWRHRLWLALLVAASVAFSLGFSCATPFAAFGVAAALTLRTPDALRLICGVWFANQVIGYTVLQYPWTANSFAWGVALGVAAPLGTLAAQWTVRRSAGRPKAVVALAALLAAFTVYEGMLFATAVVWLGGMESFTAVIIGQIFAINAGALGGLVGLHYLGTAAGLATQTPTPFSVTRRPA